MPSEAFVVKNGKKYGPFSPLQLKQLALAGEIGPDDLVKRDRDSLPVPARTIAGLVDAFQKASTQPSPSSSQQPDETAGKAWLDDVLDTESEVSPNVPIPSGTEPRVAERMGSTGAEPKVKQIQEPGPVRASDSAEEQSKPKWLTTERVPVNFDPYHIWLGIPKGKRPPTHYQLLRIASRRTCRGGHRRGC